MVLHLEEFKQQAPRKGDTLNYYENLPEFLHEMSIEDIMKHITRNGARAAYLQQYTILDYFMWLHNNYNIDLATKNFELKQLLNQNYKTFIGFYTLKDLKQGIEEALQMIEATSTSERDYDGLIAIFYLEWYGVLPKSAITIKLTDVSSDGTKIYIPAEDRTIEIDDYGVADYFARYKQKTGFKRFQKSDKEIPYTQNTFYRNTSFRDGSDVNEKTIYNIRLLFVNGSEDDRFAKKRVYYSGRYAEMFKAESALEREFSGSDKESCEIISRIFNTDMTHNQISTLIREYAVFKQSYLAQL